MNLRFRIIGLTAVFGVSGIFTLNSCRWGGKGDDTDTVEIEKFIKTTPAPFSADSAFAYIKKQTDFGYRIPGTDAHRRCADWLYATLKRFCDTVYFQKGSAVTWDKKNIPVYNIVGAFNPKAKQRGLFASHWDSRPWADADTARRDQPIMAANDGASGVGVLLEMARQLKAKRPNHGIDIIFFDAEDWGKSEHEHSFCLGSQYWGKNLHLPDYRAQYGVLLDMVGGKNAMFGREAISAANAGWVLNHTWAIARELGYTSTFADIQVNPITDDHYYVFEATRIPMIDIIQHDPERGSFAHYWHTHADNMDAVDPKTLQIVGNTMSALIFNPPINILP